MNAAVIGIFNAGQQTGPEPYDISVVWFLFVPCPNSPAAQEGQHGSHRPSGTHDPRERAQDRECRHERATCTRVPPDDVGPRSAQEQDHHEREARDQSHERGVATGGRVRVGRLQTGPALMTRRPLTRAGAGLAHDLTPMFLRPQVLQNVRSDQCPRTDRLMDGPGSRGR